MPIIHIWSLAIDHIKFQPYNVIMTQFDIHNLFRKSTDQFLNDDPHLSLLTSLPFVFESSLEEEIPLNTPGIYILTGGRQVGKSTLLKQLIRNLLIKQRIDPALIWYLPCDTISTYDQLLFHIEQFQSEIGNRRPFFLFLDEITYVREWDRAIKALADTGFFRSGSVVVTGSDSVILKEAMKRFPGRRGEADEHDFHYFPLSFSDFVRLREAPLAESLGKIRDSFQKDLCVDIEKVNQEPIVELEKHFNAYLLTGGFLKAINDFAQKKTIPAATYRTYTQWIVGDVLKRGKQEKYLRELVEALIPRLAKQISWRKITAAVSLDHHHTVSDYIHLLERMDVINIIPALREDRLRAAPKKDKKIHFNDPFILHALQAWIEGKDKQSEITSSLVEGVIASLCKRTWDSYYIKAEGEVDIAIVAGKKFYPIEIKYSPTLKRNDLKQILKYPKGIVAYRGPDCGMFDHLTVLPIHLLAYLVA
jgi:predicted AAA+ superfamily ATPase